MKKKTLIGICLMIIIFFIIGGGNIIRKAVIISKVKNKLSNGLEYYYLSREVVIGNNIDNQNLVKLWKYQNGIEVIENNTEIEILYGNEYYVIDKESKKYTKNEVINLSEVKNTFNIIEDYQYIPQSQYSENKIEENSFILALKFKVDIEEYNEQKCYAIKYKYDKGIAVTYLNKNTLNLIGIKIINNNDEVISETRFEWKELFENDNKTIEKLLDGYTEQTH